MIASLDDFNPKRRRRWLTTNVKKSQ
jgi:hypothetical protein